MSSTPLDLPILISQLPYVAKVALSETSKSEVQKQLFGPLINEHIRQNESKVQQVDKKEEVASVDRDGHQKQEQQAQSERKNQEKEEESSSDAGASSNSPWAGNIVNVKI
jgi:hypothetical protein